jgi:hypothetical protein
VSVVIVRGVVMSVSTLIPNTHPKMNRFDPKPNHKES